MSSYRLITPTGAILLKSYDTDLAVASIAITIFMQYIAMQLASTDAYFSKSKGEIMADFLKTPTSRDPVDAVKSYSKGQILFLVCTHNPWRILCGGLLSGGALVIMRYMGMASVNIQGSIHISPGHIVAHLLTSVLGCMVGFWVFFRVLSVLPSLDILRKVVAIYGGVLLAGVQYIALAGVLFRSRKRRGRDHLCEALHRRPHRRGDVLLPRASVRLA
jgi:NO-binding membrane sensor protein with MHYT domain